MALENILLRRYYIIGLLFIIIDDFPNEVLWRLWLQHYIDSSSSSNNSRNMSGDSSHSTTSTTTIRCWFHAKYPKRVTSLWVRERLGESEDHAILCHDIYHSMS